MSSLSIKSGYESKQERRMIRCYWSSYCVTARLYQSKIQIDVLPYNVPLGIDEGFSVYHKSFTGDLTQANIECAIDQKNQHLRQISTFFGYIEQLFDNFNQDQSKQLPKKYIKSQRIIFQKSVFQGKQQIIVIIKMPCRNEADVKIEPRQEQFQSKRCISYSGQSRKQLIIKLRQKNLSEIALLNHYNLALLNENDYLKNKFSLIQARIKSMPDDWLKTIEQHSAHLKDKIKDFTLRQMQKNKKHSKNKIEDNFTSKNKQASKQKIKDICVQIKKESNSQNASQTQEQFLIKHEELNKTDKSYSQQNRITEEPKIRIPILFDEQNQAYHHFQISENNVKKIGGHDYPMMILKYIIPNTGVHYIEVKYRVPFIDNKRKQRSSCIQIGVIEESNKYLLHSSITKNYVKYKCNDRSIHTNVNGKKTKSKQSKMRTVQKQQIIEMNICKSECWIKWKFCFGEVLAKIPKELVKLSLVPFIGIFTTGDAIEFLQMASQSKIKNQ